MLTIKEVKEQEAEAAVARQSLDCALEEDWRLAPPVRTRDFGPAMTVKEALDALGF